MNVGLRYSVGHKSRVGGVIVSNPNCMIIKLKKVKKKKGWKDKLPKATSDKFNTKVETIRIIRRSKEEVAERKANCTSSFSS